MSTAQKKRPFQKRKKKFAQQRSSRSFDDGIVRIDYGALPADLDEEGLAELEASLPKSTRKTKPKRAEYGELQALTVEEIHDIAEAEKVADPGHQRHELITAVIRQRLEKRVPIGVEGTLEVVPEGHAFLRYSCHDYITSHEDIYVPPSLVTAHGLVAGMTIKGLLRARKPEEKLFTLLTVEEVDGETPDELASRTPFKELTPIYPIERVLLEGTDDNPLEMRIVDLITPIGLGQRGLIVAPPRTGKTVLLQMLAKSIQHNCPQAHMMVLLIDERPEEVTDFVRTLEGSNHEVISSTFDEPAARHIRVAEMCIAKARSMVEGGRDVVILLDSITRLARACNIEAPSNGKLLSGGIEATALQMPKRFFGSARKMEDGGSLTILGTALIETGSKMDEVIFEEFKGTGNMEIVLDRRISDRRIFPAIDINRSGTRKEELLFESEEMRRVWMLRKVLNELDPVEAMEMLIQKMKKTRVNGEFLLTIGS